MKRFRIEIFNRSDLAFKAFSEIEEPDIYFDELVISESMAVCPGKVECSRGDFAQIRINGKVYYQGLVYDWMYDGYRTEITLHQLSDLLNIESFANVALLSSQKIEVWFSNLLSAAFNGSDASARLPGFTVVRESSTSGAHAATDNGAYNLYDLAGYFFKIYGVILDISFDYMTRTVTFRFHAVPTSAMQFDLSVSDVIEFEIEPANSSDSPNKVMLRNEAKTSQEATYYWHPSDFSGTIDTDSTTNRVIPVVTQCDTVMVEEGQTFAQAALAKAEEILYATLYDDLIHVTIRAESALITDWGIGQIYILHDGSRKFNTILTAIHTEGMSNIELTFGYVRKRLTQILKMKGRTL